MYYRRYYARPSYKTSATRFCASVVDGGGRAYQINSATPRHLVQMLRDMPLASVAKIYTKGHD